RHPPGAGALPRRLPRGRGAPIAAELVRRSEDVMTQTKSSMWDRPTTFIILTAWAILVGAGFELWLSKADGRPFSPAGAAVLGPIATYAVATIAALASILVALALRKQLRFLADFNFSMAVVLVFMSLGVLDHLK